VTWLTELTLLLQQPRVWVVQQRIEALMLEHAEEMVGAYALAYEAFVEKSRAEGQRDQ
jgi:hypothetical protein